MNSTSTSSCPALPPTVDAAEAPTRSAHGQAAIRGGIFGNYVDQINIFLPVTALAPALVTVAGPHAGVTTGAFVIMATLLGRPLGSMIFGRISDRVGRTSTTKVAIAGTAACSLAIAMVPAHNVIGAASIAAVIALRFLGGVFLAGEYTSAIPLAMEWSAPRRRGLVSGLIMSMAPWAQATIAAVTLVLLTVLGPTTYAQWGWRASFAAGGIASLVLLAYYIRRVADAPLFLREQAAAAPGAAPQPRLLAILFGAHSRTFWQVFLLMSGLWIMTNMVVIVLASRLVSTVGLDARQVSIVMVVASCVQAVGMAISGHLSTLVGRRRYYIGYGLLASAAAPLLWLVVMGSTGALAASLVTSVLHLVTVCAYGPIGAYLNERFTTSVRATGYGTAYSLSLVVPALYPYYLPTLQGWLGANGAVVGLLILAGLLVSLGAFIGPSVDTHADLESTAAPARQPA